MRIGIVVIAFLVGVIACEPYDAPPTRRVSESTSSQPSECREYIALHSAATLAAEFGKSEMWVLANHKINLWQNGSDANRGRVVGKMHPSSHARLLAKRGSYYKVRSPLDGSVGWVNAVQVDRTVWQDTKTNRVCDNDTKTERTER